MCNKKKLINQRNKMKYYNIKKNKEKRKKENIIK